MYLKWFRVREFQSVKDSGVVNAGDIICLVGKNEAGKSTLLKALYRLNPVVDSEGNFDVTRDYPRIEVEDYRLDIEAGRRQDAIPITACYGLEDGEVSSVHALFGNECMQGNEVTLTKSYQNKRDFILHAKDNKGIEYLIQHADFSEPIRQAIETILPEANLLSEALRGQEQTAEVKRITAILDIVATQKCGGYIWNNILKGNEPKYMYFDEYYQMRGHENIEALMKREGTNQLLPSDHPMLGLVRLARLKLNDILNPNSTLELKNKLEGASNHLSKQVLKYWSQNKHLRMTFDVRPARPADPEGMRTGTNIWGGVFDTRHSVTTELGTRSRGFVWFFSFLAWYSDVKKNPGSVILLLDEPGLTLHAKAQQDLLRYFETELKSQHQLIYSTHSPFMIDPANFERVRIVQDRSIDAGDQEFAAAGTEVLEDIFAASSDSLFPLQGALGYDLHQTLFVGPFSLVVEGVADLLFLQAMSSMIQEEGGEGLDARWTITPVGGAAKVPTFVALLGAQSGMTIATLIDTQSSDMQRIEELYKQKLLRKANVLTFSDFTGQKEADIEDMFGADFYIDLVNKEFAGQLAQPLQQKDLPPNSRILKRVENYLEKKPLKSGQFGHYRPARYFAENLAQLSKSIPKEAKERFAKAFNTVNRLLK